MERSGYQPDFLGAEYVVELPTISAEKIGHVLTSEALRDGQLLDYPNYSLLMSTETRQALFSAGNADFSINTGSGRNFRIDSRIGAEEQLGNIYYKDLEGVENPYDRGHLTRRDAVSWGPTRQFANKASRDTCYFTNVSLQHKNFNQDEWNALERAIEHSNMDSDNRFNIFVGPIFTEMDRFVIPRAALPPARVPSAFWKIIVYIAKDSGLLKSNAFLVFQDDESIKAMRQVLGGQGLDVFALYQTPTTLIEDMAGIEFPDLLFDNNPMIFSDFDAATALGVATPQLQRVRPLQDDHGIIFQQ